MISTDVVNPQPSPPPFWTALALLTLCAATACDKPSSTTEAAAPPSSSAPAESATAAASSVAPALSAPVPSEPLQLLQFQFTSDVKAKEPIDQVEAAEPGMRVWAHLKLRNRASDTRVVHLVFKVNGESRTTMDLNVDPSWSFRTWAYNTLRKSDKTGEVQLTATDDSGAVLVDKSLPIRAKAVKKPLKPGGS